MYENSVVRLIIGEIDTSIPFKVGINKVDSMSPVLCLDNVAFVSTFLFHYFSNVSANYMIRNRKRTGDMLSTLLTPTLNGMDVSIFPISSLTAMLLYIIIIAEQNRVGATYLDRLVTRSFWLEVLKYFTRYSNATQLSKLRLCLSCSRAFSVNLPY